MIQNSPFSQLQEHLDTLDTVPDTRSYWMIRTQSGSLYDSFVSNGFVAIEHERVPLSTMYELRKRYPADRQFLKAFKEELEKIYPEERRPGLIANQLMKFVYDVKKNDVIVIPSYAANNISFGVVTESFIRDISETELEKTKCSYRKRKKVRWIKELDKIDIDPYLYKMLISHQAISNVSKYSQLIERNINNFFIKDNEGHLIFDVKTTEEIGALELFQTGYYLLEVVEKFYKEQGVDIDLKSIDLKINLNSPGKIHFKAPKASTVWLIAVLFVGIAGGGVEFKSAGFNLGTDGLLKAIESYKNSAQDREMKDTLMKNIKHLKIKDPDDAIKLLQQFSENKNLPK